MGQAVASAICWGMGVYVKMCLNGAYHIFQDGPLDLRISSITGPKEG